MLKVLGRRASINVRKVLAACDEVGCAYELDESDAFRSVNPNGLMPVLIDGEQVLWESNTIVRYLAAKHGREDLLPSDPSGRARVEQWMDWQATELNDAWRYAFLALARRKPGYDDASRVAESVAAWNGMMSLLDARLASTNGYVAGAAFTVADIVVGLSVHRWRRTPIGRPTLARVDRYYAALKARAAFAPHARDDVP